MTFHAPDPLGPLAARTKPTADIFEAGERTGKFRGGEDDLITDAQGNSRISFEDYAIALPYPRASHLRLRSQLDGRLSAFYPAKAS